MALPDLFSRRKRAESGSADPLQYDQIPKPVRIQIAHVFDAAMGSRPDAQYEPRDSLYKQLCEFFRTELGVFRLANGHDHQTEFVNWFVSHTHTDVVVDAIEVLCRVLEAWKDKAFDRRKEKLQSAINEINGRLLEACVGYQFENGQMIQADSAYLHKNVTVEALHLLLEPDFAAANEEFLSAHSAYRSGEYEDALTDCAKAFESVLKVIAHQKGWSVASNATAKGLLDAAFTNGLVPAFLQSEFAGLRSILESGVPTVRNKSSAHGAGTTPRTIPKQLAAFQLHQTAAAIIFLVESARNL